MTDAQEDEKKAGRFSLLGFFGSALVVLGFLWMALSGLCGAAFLILVSADGVQQGASWLELVAAVTGASVTIGFLVFGLGRLLKKISRKR